MRKAKIYYYNQYSPNKIIRKWLSRVIFMWADKKYGSETRIKKYGYATLKKINDSFYDWELTKEQKQMQDKWHYWMNIKNKMFWHKTLVDRIMEKILN